MSYNILLGCPSLKALGIVVSTLHLTMKFQSDTGTIITVHADQRTARECYMESLRLCLHTMEGASKVGQCMEARTKVEEVEELELDPKTNDDNQVKLVEETSAFQLGPKEGWVTQLENQLPNNDNS